MLLIIKRDGQKRFITNKAFNAMMNKTCLTVKFYSLKRYSFYMYFCLSSYIRTYQYILLDYGRVYTNQIFLGANFEQSDITLCQLLTNQIVVFSFEDISSLSDSASLSEISLDGNPITQEQYYKQIVLRHMQQLKQLDMKRVTVRAQTSITNKSV